MRHHLQINPRDNVAVMLDDSSPEVPRGHKFALRDIKAGEEVVKYGMPIGHAAGDIRRGEHVHVHNLKTSLDGILEYRYAPSGGCGAAGPAGAVIPGIPAPQWPGRNPQ